MIKMKLYIGVLLFFLASNLSGQCFPDRHSTTWFDAWTSCETKENPNPVHAESHWILYDFGQAYQLKESRIWNINDPSNLDNGFRRVHIDYSLDGVEWFSHGQISFQQGTGLNTYEGFEGPDFENVDAQFLLLTAVDNFGGECYGFGEIKINVEASTVSNKNLQRENVCLKVNAFPNPFADVSSIDIISQCDGPISYNIRDIFGRTIEAGILANGNQSNRLDFNSSQLASGNYVIQLQQGNSSMNYKLVKI